jgi:hypothetical protein
MGVMPTRLLCWALVLSLAATGCISGFEQSLGPVESGFIEPDLLGSWMCSSADDPAAVDLTFVDFDGIQYYLRAEDHRAAPDSLRGIATRLGNATFLSLRPLAPRAEEEWTVLQYSIEEAGRLSLRYVNPQPFEDVLSDPQAVRDSLLTRLEDPDVVSDLFSCSRPVLSPAESQP